MDIPDKLNSLQNMALNGGCYFGYGSQLIAFRTFQTMTPIDPEQYLTKGAQNQIADRLIVDSLDSFLRYHNFSGQQQQSIEKSHLWGPHHADPNWKPIPPPDRPYG